MNGVSKQHVPRMILHNENIDFKTHRAHCVGDLAQSHKEKQECTDNARLCLLEHVGESPRRSRFIASLKRQNDKSEENHTSSNK